MLLIIKRLLWPDEPAGGKLGLLGRFNGCWPSYVGNFAGLVKTRDAGSRESWRQDVAPGGAMTSSASRAEPGVCAYQSAETWAQGPALLLDGRACPDNVARGLAC